jgi:hypothetical protein
MKIIINNEKFKISNYISGFHLKKIVSKKYNLNPNKIRLYYLSKEIEDKKSILSYKIINNSKIELFESKLKGGNSLLYNVLIVILLLILYSVLMLSGFMNIISYIYTSGLVFIGKYIKIGLQLLLGNDNLFLNLLTSISSIILSMFRSFALFITVWAITAYITFSIFKLRTDDICSAYRNNYYLSKWIGIIYVVIYGFFNLFNTLFDLLSNISQSTMIIGPVIKLITRFAQKGWDSIKFFPVYMLPKIGSVVKDYHRGIDISMIYFTAGKNRVNEINKLLHSPNFSEFEKKINTDKEIQEFIKENQLFSAIEYLKWNYLSDAEKERMIKNGEFGQKDIITARFIYWFLNNIVIFIELFYWVFKLSCGNTDTSPLEKMKENLISKLSNTSKDESQKKDLQISIDYLNRRIKNIEENEGLDQDCVSNILKTSNAAGGFSFFFYIIILIILLIFMPY